MRRAVARSTFVWALPLALGACSAHGRGLPPIPDGPGGLTRAQQVDHALARLTFGARPGDFDAVRRMGLERWIERQLHPEGIPDTLVGRLLARDTLLALDPAELLARVPAPGRLRRAYDRELSAAGVHLPGQATDSAVRAALQRDSADYVHRVADSYRLSTALQRERVLRATFSERQLQEVMTDFWENHFSVWYGKGDVMRYVLPAFDRDVVRPRALGKFRELLGAVAHSPAMLYYLDNWRNGADRGEPILARRRAGPGRNENYARELMELHTLGVNGGYTQQDVIEVARAFSGWTIRAPDSLAAFRFDSAMHDAGPKLVLGHVLPGGRGMEEGEEVLDILARSPATARFLATKLVRHFVADDPPPALVARAADAYLRTDGDIRQVLRTILGAPEFWARSAYRSRLKSPFELVASTVRALGAPPDSSARTLGQIGYLGQSPWAHPFPDGWPDVASGWIGSDAMIRRISFAARAPGGLIPGATPDLWRRAALQRLDAGTSAAEAVAALLLGDEPPPVAGAPADTVPSMDAHALAALTSADGDRVRAILDSVAAPTPAARAARAPSLGNASPVLLRRLLGLALASPVFQRH